MDGEKPDKQSKTYLVGAAALVIAAIMGWWLIGRGPDKPAVSEAGEAIAVVRVEKVMQAHKSYGKLKELRQQEKTITDELGELRSLSLSLLAPQAARQPFEHAVLQKTRQKEIAAHGALMEELRAAEKKKRAELEPKWLAARAELNASYMNAILNIRLKIDNADNMKLKPEGVELLKQQLEKLREERAVKQYSLDRRYEREISDYIAGLAAERGVMIDGTLADFSSDVRTAEMRKRSAAQKRNVEQIQKNLLQSIERQQKMIAKKAALKAKKAEIAVIEEHILADISSRATKLALLKRLSLIIGSVPREENGGFPAVINIKAIDLTDELIKELGK